MPGNNGYRRYSDADGHDGSSRDGGPFQLARQASSTTAFSQAAMAAAFSPRRFHSGDMTALEFDTQGAAARRPWWCHWIAISGMGIAAFIVLILVSIAVSSASTAVEHSGAPTTAARVHRIAFGSCTQRFAEENRIWMDAIVPSAPDTWLWLGDLAYMDQPAVDCSAAVNKAHPDCHCAPTPMRHAPGYCFAGDAANARRKVDGVIRSHAYAGFLDFMCPGWAARGAFPPAGADLSVCPRSILGVYDDHDFGWNNGNGRQLGNKDEMKQIFLDAIGEAEGSARRNGQRGIYDWRTLNPGAAGREVDVLLLDERYHRAPLPCHVMRAECGREGLPKHKQVWCDDFLGAGNVTRPGSCCAADDAVARGWCLAAAHRNDSRFAALCEPASPDFGNAAWAVGGGGELEAASGRDWRAAVDESPFCEVLGKVQRRWLDGVLTAKAAPITLVASGSVLLGHAYPDPPTPASTGANATATSEGGGQGTSGGVPCAADDWDCYRPAQRWLLGRLAALAGCVVVLTGDYHRADIKRLVPGEDAPYASVYPTDLTRPIYQIMASGMHNSTAVGLEGGCDAACCGHDRDEAGLRGPGRVCNVFGEPNFGLLDLDWEDRTIRMAIMRGDGGGIAQGADGADIELKISMETCQPL